MASSKKNFGLHVTGLKEITERLEKLGASAEKTASLALKQSKNYVNKGIENAMASSKYDFENRTVKEVLKPIDIKQQEGYLLHNEELLRESKKLFDEIQKFIFII